jgi:hypothetical protein
MRRDQYSQTSVVPNDPLFYVSDFWSEGLVD